MKSTSLAGLPEKKQGKKQTVLVKPTRADTCMVGIGASAGGLEALEQFLGHVPPDSGFAYVVIQHMDPNHQGMLVELLQRVTPMQVVQVKERMKVAADHVYVIPPNRDLSILKGLFYLFEPSEPRGLRLPIDFFFRSLADERHEGAIGVILSGMGSDGSLGVRSIKERGGAVFVQEPASAKFDGMPRSAIDSGFSDVVAPVAELPQKIMDYLRHAPHKVVQPDLVLTDNAQSGLGKVLLLLRTHTGHDFSLYKKSTVYRRIERRMGLQKLDRISDYVNYLRSNPEESKLLFKELLIGVTSFFRDPLVWEQIKSEVLPVLMDSRPNGGVFRIWIPGCSTGEEAYSLAMLFRELMDERHSMVQLAMQIFATDLDEDAIEKARQGAYPLNIATDVGAARLGRFFTQDERGYRVNTEIREMVIFAPQNLVIHPPFTKLDLLCCRNLLIYLESELQKKLVPLFHYSLNPGGFLVLGSSETIGSATDLFTPLTGKNRIFRRKNTPLRAELSEFSTAFSNHHFSLANPNPVPVAISVPNLQTLTDSLILQRFAPAAVLTTESGDILYFSGKTGKYLEPPAGKANLNIFAMAREGLGGALNEAFSKAVRQNMPINCKRVEVSTGNGTQHVELAIQPLLEPEALRGMLLVVFKDVVDLPSFKELAKSEQDLIQGARLSNLGQELLQAREELQTTREEMQTSQEELKSANEELQSTNEELQSTNEELNTSKEEMQSMNEELQTVNHELQAKVDELIRSNDDMKNLLNSTDIATLFLDDELRVRRFTTQTTSLIKLIPGDAGRPITDIVSELEYPALIDDAGEVLRTLVFHEQQVSTRDGRWYNVRIMPYRTQDKRIEGVVITFVNISAAKELEKSLREAITLLQGKFSGQDSDQEAARTLANVMQQAQDVLQKSIKRD